MDVKDGIVDLAGILIGYFGWMHNVFGSLVQSCIFVCIFKKFQSKIKNIIICIDFSLYQRNFSGHKF